MRCHLLELGGSWVELGLSLIMETFGWLSSINIF